MDSATRFSTSGFFHESVSPKPLSTPLGPFRIFLKIPGDICNSRFTTGVVDTGGKWKKSEKFNNLAGAPLDSRVNIYLNFCLQAHFKVSAAWYCSHCLPPVSKTLVKLVAKFAAGVVDTGGSLLKYNMGVQLNFSQCVFALAEMDLCRTLQNIQKEKMEPKIQMVLETNGLAFCFDVRHQETKWAHLFCFC